VEPADGAGRGLLAALAEHAAVVVTDDFPAFFLPRMVAAAGQRLGVRLEAVDSNGLLPMAAGEREHPTAYAFRRLLQRELLGHLDPFPLEDPCHDLPPAAALPAEISERWPAADLDSLTGGPQSLAALPIDHSVTVVAQRGGSAAASQLTFVDARLRATPSFTNRPDDGAAAACRLPHFGHLSAATRSELMLRGRSPRAWSTGRRTRRVVRSPDAEAFLDQLVTWRELASSICHHRGPIAGVAAGVGPQDARGARHRPPRAQLLACRAHRRATTRCERAQRQLVREGTIHNYLRMLWGKKILEWTDDPHQALEVMTELNNRFALDGRDPNSETGIFWVLGRHDRPWAPERPIFGTIRYMSSANTARKLPVRRYLERYA
jgi:deoxyribodipyrimidine photo-lyase